MAIALFLLGGCVESPRIVDSIELVLDPQLLPDVPPELVPLSRVLLIDGVLHGQPHCGKRGLNAIYRTNPPPEPRETSLVSVSADGNIRLPLPSHRSEYAVNPWNALLVHVDLRTAGGPSGNVPALPLLEGCLCVRLSTGSHSDPLIDAEMKSRCTLVGTSTRPPIPVEMTAIVPDDLRVGSCGTGEAVAIAGTRSPLDPKICLNAPLCFENGNPPGCLNCPEHSCLYQDGVGVMTQLVSASPTMPLAMPPRAHGDPESSLDLRTLADCTELQLDAWIPGRKAEKVSIPITCVPPMQAQLASSFELPRDSVTSVVMVPERKVAGTVQTPAHVALLVPDDTGALSLVELGIDGDRWTTFPTRPAIVPPNAHLIAFRAYERTAGGEPMLALATGSSTYGVTIGVVRPGTRAGAAEVLSRRPRTCEPEPCGSGCTPAFCQTFAFSGTLRDADLDGDGATDLIYGPQQGRALLRYYGSATSTTGLTRTCGCSAVGSAIDTFELLQIGGPDPATAPQIDLAIGDSEALRLAYGGSPICFGCEPLPRVWRAGARIYGRARLSGRDADDLLVLDEGSNFDGAGTMPATRVLFAGPWDFTQLRLEPLPARTPTTISGQLGTTVGDFNGDGHLDLGLAHGDRNTVWLGGGRRAVVGQSMPGGLAFCVGGGVDAVLAGDMDGDGTSDFVALCSPTTLRGTTLEWHRATRASP